mgnify:CR=1 FL=1
MKRVLVTGAGGTVGLQVIRFLLSEGKYDITALELKTKKAYSRIKKFRKRINIVFGDVNDSGVIDALVKENDIIIHLAGVLPQLANVRDDLCKEVDFNGTRVIVKAIKNYNPTCHLFYASSTSVYGKQNDPNNITVKSSNNIDSYDYYSKYKLKCEEYIKKNIKNYTIYRLAYILGDPGPEEIIYNVVPSCNMETVSVQNVGYAFACGIDHLKELNRKTFNVSGGESFRVNYRDYMIHLLKYYGLTLKFFSSWLLSEKNYYSGFYKDGNVLDDILKFRSKSLNYYYSTLYKYKRRVGRFIPRMLALPFISSYKKKLGKDK